jgi:hypothetical protein
VFPVLIFPLVPIPINAMLLLLITLIEEIPLFLTSISDWGSVFVPTPIFAGYPITYKEFVTVATPIEATPAFIEDIEIEPVDTRDEAVVAVPLRFPTKLDAVITPEILILDGKTEVLNVPEDTLDALMDVKPAPEPENAAAVIIPDKRMLDGKNEVLNVPDVILDALKDDKLDPLPIKDAAVTIPFEYTLPLELIPIPPEYNSGFSPT